MSSKIIFTQALPKPPFYLLRSHHWTKRRIAIYVDLTLHTKPFQCEFQPSCSREHQWIPQRSCKKKQILKENLHTFLREMVTHF